MLKKTKRGLLIIIYLIIISGCQNPMIPSSYLLKPGKVSKGITGSWIRIISLSDTVPKFSRELSGELIAIQYDTVYVLTGTGFSAIKKDKIYSATLYLFKPQGNKFLLITAFSLLPNLIGAIANPEETGLYFLALGIPLFLTGSIMVARESFWNYRFEYPNQNQIEDFIKFARFPQGLRRE